MIRAGVDDPAMARVVGIRVSRLFTIVFCLGAWLAGFAGVIGGPILSVYPGLDQEMLPLALVVVILGGSGSLLGSLVGQPHRRLPLQLRPGDVPRARLRRAVPADADRPGGAAPGPVRAAGGVKRAGARRRRSRCWPTRAALGRQHRTTSTSRPRSSSTRSSRSAINVLAGYAGLVSLGHAGLFGIAAYTGAQAPERRPRPCRRRRRRARRDPRRGRGVRGAGAARHRARLRHDHRGAGPDRLGRRLPLDQPHQRRQRHLHQRPAEPARACRWPRRAAFYWATLRRVPRRRRCRWRSSSPRRSAPACAARAISRGA